MYWKESEKNQLILGQKLTHFGVTSTFVSNLESAVYQLRDILQVT